MSGMMRLAVSAGLFAAAACLPFAASALPLDQTPATSAQSGSVQQVRTVCYYDQWGRRLCYNTSGRPMYRPRPYYWHHRDDDDDNEYRGPHYYYRR